MSDEQTPRQQAKEAAAIRRRWITLGEVLAVAAVAISGLTLWNSYSERVDGAAEKEAARIAERQAADADAGTIVLQGRIEEDGRAVRLLAADEDRVVQSVRIAFPGALGIDPVETLSDPRLPVAPLAAPVRRARSAESVVVPVLVTTRFTLDGRLHEAQGRYALGLERRDRLIGSDAIRITGFAYRGPAGADAAAAIDREWNAGA